MNEASERVLLKFAELLRNNPNGNVPFLWVQAGGRVASQQSFAADASPDRPLEEHEFNAWDDDPGLY